jgi:hypothetical protein
LIIKNKVTLKLKVMFWNVEIRREAREAAQG